MKKWLSALLCCALLLTGCRGKAPEQTGTVYLDDLGREVMINEPPRRVACLLGSFADVWLLAGGQVAASVDDAWADFGLELPDAVNLGKTKEPNLEKLLELQPELVLASANTQGDLELMPTLEAAGIPTLYFDVSTFEDYLNMLDICTQITGQTERYETYGLAQRQRIDGCVARVGERFGDSPPTVLYLRFSAASVRVKGSQGSVLGEMLSRLGCVNIADSRQSLLENLSVEHIVLADPDYIFFVQLGDDTQGAQARLEAFFQDNPALTQLTAVKEGRVRVLDKELYNLKPNARWADAYEGLEAIFCEQTP